MGISMSALQNNSSSTTTTITTLLVLAFIFFINTLKFRLKPYNKSKRPPLPPGPAPWPILGNVPEMLRNKPTFRWLHVLMKEMNTDILCIRLGNVHVITVTCPKIGLEIMKKQDDIFASRPLSIASRTFSAGYLSTALVPYGEQWKKMRKVLKSEIICPKRHHWLHDKRVEEADNLVKYVYNKCMSFGNVNIRTVTRQYTGNVIRRLMFNKRYFGEGRKDGGPGIEEEEHVHALFSALAYLFAFCISDYFPFLTGLDLDGHEKIVKEANETIKKYHEPIVNERIQKWRHADPNNSNVQKEPEDLLDVLINLKDEDGKPLLTPEEIKAQTTEIMFAAVDNPANAVEWALAEMINKPEILQKALEELDRVVGKERLVQESDIPQLNYLKACARESFRLHPMVAFNVPHVSRADTTIAGYFIPKGSHILLSRSGLGRNPKIWDNPLEFKPERHLSNPCKEVVLTEPDLRFISFSTGRRGCIAATMGTSMTIMLLGRLLQGFTWSAPPNVSAIDLTESRDDMFLAKPLVARARPRLPLNLYPLN